MGAVQCNMYEIAKLLLKHGAVPSPRALVLAVVLDRPSILKLFLDMDITIDLDDLTIRAVFCERKSSLDLLLEKGGSINLAIETATKNNRYEMEIYIKSWKVHTLEH